MGIYFIILKNKIVFKNKLIYGILIPRIRRKYDRNKRFDFGQSKN